LNSRYSQIKYKEKEIKEVTDLMRIMRYNNSFKSLNKDEPYGHSICALDTDFGGIDSKVVNVDSVRNGIV